jgi:acyl-ACP thioesterase
MNNEEQLIHFEQGQIKGYDVDIHQNATIPAMVMMMQEAAMQHVLRIGVSAKELVKENLGWVLHQQYFEFFRQPSLGEKLIIQTNPTGLERIFTYRDFQMEDENEKVVAQASSSWILMDIETRKMAKYPTFISEMLQPSNDFEKLPRPPRMKFKIENPDFEKTFQVGFHDLDFNGHLSNFYYFKWMLDSMPSEFLKNNQLQSLQIRFKEECYLDDEVKVLIEKVNEKTYVNVLLKNDKILAEGKTIWK